MPRNTKPFVDVGDAGLLGVEFQPETFDPLGELLQQRLCLRAVAFDQDDEVVREPDKPVGRVACALQVVASAGVAAHLLPVRLVLAVERGERDVRQQGRSDPALRGARDRPLEATRLRHHAGFQERPDEREHAFVLDPPPHLHRESGV